MARMKLTADIIGRVTIQYDVEVWDGKVDRISREFTCPPYGGYVQELTDDGGRVQTCEKLARTGTTLIAVSREGLPDLIRREYRRKARAARAE